MSSMYEKRVLPNGVRLIAEKLGQCAHRIGRHLGRQRQPV